MSTNDDDVLATGLFLTAWARATPEQRAALPLRVAEGLAFESYQEYVPSPPAPSAGQYPYVRVWVVPVTIYDPVTGQVWARLLPVQHKPNAAPVPTPAWCDPETLPLLEELADLLAEAGQAPPRPPTTPADLAPAPPLTLADYLRRRGLAQHDQGAEAPEKGDDHAEQPRD